MKILILGSSGMAGHMIEKYFISKRFDITTAARNNADIKLDLFDQNTVKSLIDKIHNFDFVINCIGLLVKDSIENPDQAILINSWWPKYLESTLSHSETKLIHLSTDCVFNGKRGYYIETDNHNETNMYGRSKSLGEVDNNKDVTFRMSIIGPELRNGSGLFNFVQSNKNKNIQGWTNVYWNGMTTLQLAKCLEDYILDPSHTGIYHLVNNDVSIDKFNLISKINSVFNFQANISQGLSSKNINKILLNDTRIKKYSIPNYDIQLEELKQFYY